MVERIRIARVPGAKMPRVQPFKEMGGSGTPVYAGFVQTKDRSAKWSRGRRYEISSEIVSNISIVAASVRYFLNLITHPRWSVVPADENDRESVELAEFVDDVIHSMDTPWSRVIRKSGSYQFHGFGIQEWIAKRREDGLIGLRDIESRPQHTIERWEINDNGGVEGVWQREPQTSRLLGIPKNKMIYMVDDTFTDSPEGLGIFRNLLEPYERLKRFLALETRTFERDLRGIPIGRIPYTKLREAVSNGVISKDDSTALIKAMENFVELQVKESNTGMVLDSQPYESIAADGPKVSAVMQWGMELLQGAGNGLTELSTAIDRIQREMARIMGTEHLMMGDQGGNRALATDKSRNLYLVANSVLGDIVSSFDSDVITPLWWLNGLDETKRPYFAAEDVAFKDVVEITAALRDMASAGAVLDPRDPVINDLRDLLGVSRYEVPDILMGDNGGPPLDNIDDSMSSLSPEEVEEEFKELGKRGVLAKVEAALARSKYSKQSNVSMPRVRPPHIARVHVRR